MARWEVGPDSAGTVWLSVSQAAWLMRTSGETIRRWVREGSLATAGDDTRIDWENLHARATRDGGARPAHWAWLAFDLSQRPSDSESKSFSDTELEALQRHLARAESERDIAVAEAENLDQAVMAYRDSWRRRVQPQSLLDLPATEA